MITTRRAIDSCLARMPRHSSSTARDPSWRVHVVSIVFLVLFLHAASTTGPLTVSTLQISSTVIDMAVDSQGRLLTVDRSNGTVYRILPEGTRSTLVTGLNSPYGITIDNTTNIPYVADTYNHCIKSVSSSGTTTAIAGLCGASNFGYVDGVGSAARFNVPVGIVYHAAGVLYDATVSTPPSVGSTSAQRT